MKKIGIVTLFDYVNIGNKLQNYALESAISQIGYDVTTIVRNNRLVKLSMKDIIKAILGCFVKKYRYALCSVSRRKRFKEFSDKYITIDNYKNYVEIKNKANNVYDAFVVGSDQVWHFWRKDREEFDFFFLGFSDNKKRICYAPSFGYERIDEKIRTELVDGLCGFTRLSCREYSGVAIIQELSGREAVCVCDPTFLLTKEEWRKIEKKPPFEVPEEYVLTYFLSSKDGNYYQYINKVRRNGKTAIIDVYDPTHPEYYNVTPDEFLYLIDHASAVCTDSFHGTVFSILFEKQFRTFKRIGQGQMNGRLETLLKKNNLQWVLNDISDRIIYYDGIEEAIIKERKIGLQYLKECLDAAL